MGLNLPRPSARTMCGFDTTSQEYTTRSPDDEVELPTTVRECPRPGSLRQGHSRTIASPWRLHRTTPPRNDGIRSPSGPASTVPPSSPNQEPPARRVNNSAMPEWWRRLLRARTEVRHRQPSLASAPIGQLVRSEAASLIFGTIATVISIEAPPPQRWDWNRSSRLFVTSLAEHIPRAINDSTKTPSSSAAPRRNPPTPPLRQVPA